MELQELGLGKRHLELLKAAGLDTVDAVRTAGREGLLAIDGIGPASAAEILAAVEAYVQHTGGSPGDSRSPAEHITVRNVTGLPVLVGHRYLYPGDVATVQRGQLKPGLAEV
ncbi:hypothetical protein [Caldilinea sp.]|uniref:hypothetical protein n=1 Tax=Caldilinea sp. TaxID=2293560 RepID=UPI0021DD31C3|nr:hypothetical protein [Caldilinea sp.]GIV73547.1 MAG: hypothetical protein KatS3mg049_2103 [Caldilinea sp.]